MSVCVSSPTVFCFSETFTMCARISVILFATMHYDNQDSGNKHRVLPGSCLFVSDTFISSIVLCGDIDNSLNV